jgi:hypothetical protein
VREVIVVEEEGFTKTMSDSLQVRECAEEVRDLLEGIL